MELHPDVGAFVTALNSSLMALSQRDAAVSLLEKAIVDYPDQFAADIALSNIYAESEKVDNATLVMRSAFDRGGKSDLEVLKQFSKVLAQQKDAIELKNVLRTYRSLWEAEKKLWPSNFHRIFSAQAGLAEFSIDIFNETIDAHPDKFDADLELKKRFILSST